MKCELYGSMRGTQRSDFGCVMINCHQVMVVGGKNNLRGLKTCDIFDLESKKWSKGPKLPIEMRFCRATLVDKYVYICGLYNDFFRLNVRKVNADWRRLPSLTVDGFGCELVSDSRYVYRIGDTDTRTDFSRFDTKQKIWESLPSLSTGRAMFGAAISGEEIYAIGGKSGLSGDIILDSVEIYNLGTKEWRSGPKLPRTLFGHSVHAITNFLVVSGGQRTHSSNPLGSMIVLDTSRKEWTPIDVHLPAGVTGHSMISSGWELFIFGGQCNPKCTNKGQINMIKIYRGSLSMSKQSASMDLPCCNEERLLRRSPRIELSNYKEESHAKMRTRVSRSKLVSNDLLESASQFKIAKKDLEDIEF